MIGTRLALATLLVISGALGPACATDTGLAPPPVNEAGGRRGRVGHGESAFRVPSLRSKGPLHRDRLVAEGRVGEREGTPMPERVGVPGGIEQWSVSKAIAPFGKNGLDDVALIQTMLKIFLTAPAVVDDLPASERAEIDRIFTSTTRSGGKFADGIYGSNTRAAVGILERRIGSPVKDGIIRPIFEVDRTGRTSAYTAPLEGSKAQGRESAPRCDG